MEQTPGLRKRTAGMAGLIGHKIAVINDKRAFPNVIC
jgi:hypothetical protein